MDDPALRKELGEFGRKRVENELQWSVVSRELLAAYRFLFPIMNPTSQNNEIQRALLKLEEWVIRSDWKAYDTFDGLSSPLVPFSLGHSPAENLLAAGSQTLSTQPSSLARHQTRHEQQSDGLFCSRLPQALPEAWNQRFLERAKFCLQWLMDNPSPGFKGYSWGNHFDYQHRAGSIPKGLPTIVWTGLIGHAFVDAYELLEKAVFGSRTASLRLCRP